MLAAIAAGMLILPACTVTPLYGEASSSIAAGGGVHAPSAVASIAVKPVEDRPGQVVRNHLIFALNGGARQPDNPRYEVQLLVVERLVGVARIQLARDNVPTAGAVAIDANYVLRETATGKVVAKGMRSVNAPFDRPRQDFAARRAEINARERAGREVAEFLRIALAQDIAALPAS